MDHWHLFIACSVSWRRIELGAATFISIQLLDAFLSRRASSSWCDNASPNTNLTFEGFPVPPRAACDGFLMWEQARE